MFAWTAQANQRVPVAVAVNLLHVEKVPGRLALAPKALPASAVEGAQTGLQGRLHGLAVREGLHENRPGVDVLGYRDEKTLVVVLESFDVLVKVPQTVKRSVRVLVRVLRRRSCSPSLARWSRFSQRLDASPGVRGVRQRRR